MKSFFKKKFSKPNIETNGKTDNEKKSRTGDSKKLKKSKEKEKDSTSPSPGNMEFDLPEFTKEDLLKPVPKMGSVPVSEKAILFVKKLRLCSINFEWEPVEDMQMASKKESPEDVRAKEVKRELLLELVDYIGKNRSFINEAILIELLRMVSANLFRALPSNEHVAEGEGDEEEPVFDPAWAHLQIVYEFFLRFIISNDLDAKILKKHINGMFVLHIIELFDTEDPRERDYLKTILHRIYAKFMSLRSFVRKAINNTFYNFIYCTESHNGVAELLEILGSIINGFALPLKDEHKSFLQRVLIPMHKVKNVNTFHQQLSYCITQFVNKDAELSVPIMNGLIKYWPITNSQKEVLFLNEIEEVLELTQADEFRVIMVPLFRQLAKAIGSPHFQVAERALFLWHNEYISSLITDHREALLPIIFPVLHVNSQSHWNPTVNNLTVNVVKIFMDLDGELVEECTRRYVEDEKRKEAEKKKRNEEWTRLRSQQSEQKVND